MIESDLGPVGLLCFPDRAIANEKLQGSWSWFGPCTPIGRFLSDANPEKERKKVSRVSHPCSLSFTDRGVLHSINVSFIETPLFVIVCLPPEAR